MGNGSSGVKDKVETNIDAKTADSELLLIEKMSMYLAKMSLHDYELQ
jgi:hypothetical protein